MVHYPAWPGSEPVVRRMRQLTGELSRLRKEVELPCVVRERLYDIAGSLNDVAQSGALLEPRRLIDAYESTAPEPLTPDEHRWLPGALALIPLHWAATAGLTGGGIDEAESAMAAAEAWW